MKRVTEFEEQEKYNGLGWAETESRRAETRGDHDVLETDSTPPARADEGLNGYRACGLHGLPALGELEQLQNTAGENARKRRERNLMQVSKPALDYMKESK